MFLLPDVRCFETTRSGFWQDTFQGCAACAGISRHGDGPPSAQRHAGEFSLADLQYDAVSGAQRRVATADFLAVDAGDFI